MEITEIRVFIKEGKDKKLKAYATATFDNAFVVRNIKIIQGSKGLFIAMPSRKMKTACSKCNFKNEVGSKYCNQCGETLPAHDKPINAVEPDARSEHRDIAHPVTQEFREYLQSKILEAYQKEAGEAPQGSDSDGESTSTTVSEHN